MFKQPDMREDHIDTLLTDFTDPLFQAAFRRYFGELGIQVRDWDGLFQEIDRGDDGEKNAACVRIGADGGVIGFILFIPIRFMSWFFEETRGFIREFWIAEEFRGRGHGTALIAQAEQYFLDQGICTSVLTTETAAGFYERCGYARAPGCQAKNKDGVYVKRLK